MVTQAQTGNQARRNDIDWLRVLAVLLLVPFHTALIFSLNPRDIVYVKDTVEAPLLVSIDGIIYQFHMPLLFVIAGASTWFALRKRTGSEYLRERTFRLLVPFVFGVVALTPVMLYFQFLWSPILKGQYSSFFDYYPHFFEVTDLTGYRGNFTPGPLWFIAFLLGFSVVALPLFLYLQRTPSKAVQAMASFIEKPGALFVFPFLLLITRIPHFPADKNPVYYILLFIAGFVLMTDERFQKAVDRFTWPSLAFAAVAGPALVWWLQPWSYIYPEFSWQQIFVSLLYQFTTWCWIVAFLGLGRRFLNRGGPVLSYLSEAAYPFYVLHLPVVTVVGFFVVQWTAGIPTKYIAINLLTFALTFAIYDLIVKRTNVTRWLFGMKLRASAPHATTPRPATSTR